MMKDTLQVHLGYLPCKCTFEAMQLYGGSDLTDEISGAYSTFLGAQFTPRHPSPSLLC